MKEFRNTNSQEMFVDLGVYVDDTLNVWALGDEMIEIVRAGVAEKTNTLSILEKNADGETRGEKVCAEKHGDKQIAVFSIDDFLKQNKVTFMKVDIEGYEYRMLLGAKKIIKIAVLLLAICAYHGVSDLFDILLLIKSININLK